MADEASVAPFYISDGADSYVEIVSKDEYVLVDTEYALVASNVYKQEQSADGTFVIIDGVVSALEKFDTGINYVVDENGTYVLVGSEYVNIEGKFAHFF